MYFQDDILFQPYDTNYRTLNVKHSLHECPPGLLGLHAAEVNKYLDALEADKKIAVVKQKRGFFIRKSEGQTIGLKFDEKG